MRLRKYHPHGSVLFITFTLEEGLLLLANPLCEAILKSCLARAQTKYNLQVCHFLIEATHLHMVVVVDNPEDVPGFIRYFKTESAHMLNGLLGRDKRTIWCEGYDSPVALTPLRALSAICYLYANPAKDNLEESIDNFPGLSSWRMFTKGDHTKRWKFLRRPAFRELPPASHNLMGYTREAERLLSDTNETAEFRVSPNAWLEALGYKDPKEQERINAALIARVRRLEARASKKRAVHKTRVKGASRLRAEILNTTYRPRRRHGRRMCCLSEDRQTRIAFIQFLKELYARAKDVAQRWRLGDYSEAFPLGLYPPSMPKLAEPLAAW